MKKNKYKNLSKAKLLAKLSERDIRVDELEEKLTLLQYEFEKLKDKTFKPKPPKPEKSSKPVPKKKGAPFGHLGWFRKKPKKIDRLEIVKIKKCPSCGSSNLSKCKETTEHIQEDIILPKLETIKYVHPHYYCKGCKKVVTGVGAGEIPGSYIGPNAKSVAGFLRYDVKISTRDIKKIFKQLCNLNIVPGSIPGFNNQLRKISVKIYDDIQQIIKQGSFCHGDETGWRLGSDKYWLWSFSNAIASFFHIDKSRGQKVVKQILGDEFNGILISDFLSAYNKIKAKGKQRCLIHLERDIKKVLACNEDKPVKMYCENLLKLLDRAKQLHEDYKYKKIAIKKFERKRELLVESLKDFNFPLPDKRHLNRFSKRLIRHKNELFTFLYYPEISSHNNKAERHIRPNVIFRKITFGNRSEKGMLNHSILMSIIQTAKMNKLDPLKILKKIFILPKDKRTLALAMPP